MEIVFFHRKGGRGFISIQESFRPIIDELSKKYDVKVYNVPHHRADPISIMKNIWFIHKNSTPNGVNHITGEIHYGVLGLWGKKSVLTIHDDYAMRKTRWGGLDKCYKWLFWIFLPIKMCNVPICISPSTKRSIEGYYPTKKLKVLTHHVAPDFSNYNRKPFNKSNPRLLQVGTARNKNLETTIEVLKGVQCKLVVLKKMSESQMTLAKKNGICYENKWDLSTQEVLDEYNKADIILFPSLYEGLGMPIFEGQAAGKPVITTNKEPMNWVAGNGAVLLNDPLDGGEYKKALMKVINDDSYRENLVKKGLLNSRRFSLENAVNSYIDLYKKLFDEDCDNK